MSCLQARHLAGGQKVGVELVDAQLAGSALGRIRAVSREEHGALDAQAAKPADRLPCPRARLVSDDDVPRVGPVDGNVHGGAIDAAGVVGDILAMQQPVVSRHDRVAPTLANTPCPLTSR